MVAFILLGTAGVLTLLALDENSTPAWFVLVGALLIAGGICWGFGV